MNRYKLHQGSSNSTKRKFRECNFELVKNERNKRVALCLSCHKTFANTAIKRCEAHRKICKSTKFLSEISYIVQSENEIFNEVSNSNNQQDLILPDEYLNHSEYKDKISDNDDDKISDNDDFRSITETEMKSFSESQIKKEFINKEHPANKISKSIRESLPSSITIKSVHDNIFIKNLNQLKSNESTSSNGIETDEEKPAIQNDHIDALHHKSSDNIDNIIANFFYSCRIPLKIADSKAFKDFVKVINPNYKYPSSLDLSTGLLEKIYNDIHQKQIKYLKDEMVLLINCQKNNSCTNITTVLSGNNGQKIFFDTSEYSSNVDKFNIIESSCKLIEQSYNTKIYATVSNMLTEENEELLLETGNTESLSQIWNIYCNIEGCNLLIKEIIDINLTKQCIDILKDLEQTNCKKLLLEKGINNIAILPLIDGHIDNYYLYQYIFIYIIENLNILKAVINDIIANQETYFIKCLNMELLLKIEFIQRIEKEIAKLNPIHEFIKKCQLPNFKIADATEFWLNLSLSSELQNTLKKIKRRLLNKFNFAANILHSTYRGRNLTNEERDIGEMFLFEILDSKGLEDYEEYNTNSSNVFQTLSQKNQLSTHTFWGLASRKHSSLSNLAKKLLDIPATCVKFDQKIEINNIKRSKIDNNELSHDKLRKLIYIQYYLDQTSCNEIIQ